MNSPAYMLLFASLVFVCACAQIALKNNAGRAYAGVRIYLNRTVILSNAVFLSATLASVFLLRYIQLSAGALLNSLAYVFVPVLSAIFLKEKIGQRTILGIALIMAGMLVYAIWGAEIGIA
jgi:drug/metabolite transporter (DMT)-like permease